MAKYSSQWPPGTREGYAAACSRLSELEIAVVIALIGGHLTVVVGECLPFCISMESITAFGLAAGVLAPMWRRAKPRLSGNYLRPKSLACCVVARRTRDVFEATAASQRLASSQNLSCELIRAPQHRLRIDCPLTHHLSSRHPSQSSRSACRDLDLQLGKLQPLHRPTMRGSTWKRRAGIARGS